MTCLILLFTVTKFVYLYSSWTHWRQFWRFACLRCRATWLLRCIFASTGEFFFGVLEFIYNVYYRPMLCMRTTVIYNIIL